ncbi:MAG: preprotein translocase subunit SecA [Patescibacteria group bacterium]|nr:preprotein translocase subunit SecA [Patescibacteria group bacterium]
MALGFFKKLTGSGELRRADKAVKAINALAAEYEKLKDSELKAKTVEFRERLEQSRQSGKPDAEALDDLLPEAFAAVREASARTIKERHFDVQLMGGYVLHQGQIAEMKTGEGKTLTATLPIYLNALAGKGVHVVTVNEYLARRDTEWMGQIYQFLGLTVGSIYHDQPADEKKAAYAADITYGTNNEFGFDYLRDNMVGQLDQMVQRELGFAIVDEVDSILIDESRTPLIISGAADESGDLYARFASLIPQLDAKTDYTLDEKRKSAILTDAGIKRMEQLLGVPNIYEAGASVAGTGGASGIKLVHHMEQALQAHTLYRLDKEYVVKDGEVVIVDEFTGRLMPGRRFSEGLHQAIEAKEGVEVKQETRTMATITFQNYFRLYAKLSGMTGTAETEKEEFHKIYRLGVTVVPTHRPMIREDLNDAIYKTEQAKFAAIAEEVKERNANGQPVLLGTIAVEKSERLAKALTQAGVKHEILNAKNHAREAEIIARAGEPGSVTVSTNMAGRGTDIKLGKGVADAGGLHVIGSERHEARRIDNQLRGRSGRQGDPGTSRFYVSLEDDLMRIFGGDRIKNVMEKLKVPEDQPIQAGIVSKSIESAQKKVEGHNFDVRKHVVEYDDVMNAHREVIYKRRRKILEKEAVTEDIKKMFADELDAIVASNTPGDDPNEWDYAKIAEQVGTILQVPAELAEQLKQAEGRDQLTEGLTNMIEQAHAAKEKEQGADNMRTLERMVMLRSIDSLWVDHLDAMEHMREGIGLRGYGQKDPLTEYKGEAFRMFEELLATIRAEVTHTLFKVTLTRAVEETPTEVEQAAQQVHTAKEGDKGPAKKPVIGQEEPGEDPVDEEAPSVEEPESAKPARGKSKKAVKKEEKKERTKAKAKPEPKPQPKPQPAAAKEPEATPEPSSAKVTIRTPDGQTITPEQAEAAAAAPQVTQDGSATITVKKREGGASNPAAPKATKAPKVGRNDPCPCGSGLKYKKCGLIGAPEHQG